MCMNMQDTLTRPRPVCRGHIFAHHRGNAIVCAGFPPPPTRLPPRLTAANRVCNHRQQVCCVPCACAPNTQASLSSYLHPLKHCHSVPLQLSSAVVHHRHLTSRLPLPYSHSTCSSGESRPGSPPPPPTPVAEQNDDAATETTLLPHAMLIKLKQLFDLCLT